MNKLAIFLGVTLASIVGFISIKAMMPKTEAHTVKYCHPTEGKYPYTLSDNNSNDSFVYLGDCKKGRGENAEDNFKQCISDWCSDNKPVVDQCLNIDGVQAKVPDNMVNNSDYQCSCVAGFHAVANEVGFSCIKDEVTPPATESATVVSLPLTPAGVPNLPACDAPKFAPTITFRGRKDADTVSFSWTTVKEGLHDYLVWYGIDEHNLPWNTKVHGESVDLSGKELVGKNVWAKVAGFEEPGCAGPFSLVIDP